MERREKEERNINVRLPLVCPPPGTWPATKARVPTGNRTSDPLVCRPVLNPLIHTSQGTTVYLCKGTFKEELIPIFCRSFEIIEKGMLLDSFYEGDPDTKTKKTLQEINPDTEERN